MVKWKYLGKPYKSKEEREVYEKEHKERRMEGLKSRARKEGYESGKGTRKRGFNLGLDPIVRGLGNAGRNFSMDADKQFGFGNPFEKSGRVVRKKATRKPRYRWVRRKERIK